MARRPRTIVAGYPHYLTLLSNKSNPIFRNDQDRETFLDFIESSRVSANKDMKVHAWLLMPTYIHMIVLPEREEDPSRFMQNLGRLYVRYYNLKYRQSGPLFESRFKNFIVGSGKYLATSIRYLETRPIREGLVKKLGEYRWCSYASRQRDEGAGEETELNREDEEALNRLIYKGGIFADEKTKRAIEVSLGYRLEPKNVGRPKKRAKDKTEELLIKRRYGFRKVMSVLSLFIPDALIIIAILLASNIITINLREFLNIRHQEYIVPFDNYRWLPFMIVFIVGSTFAILGLYTDFTKFTKYGIVSRTARAMILVSLILLSLIYITRSLNISRLFVGVFALIGLFVFSLERILVANILRR